MRKIITLTLILAVITNFALAQHKPDRIFRASKGGWPIPIDNVKEIDTYKDNIKSISGCAAPPDISFISKDSGVVRSVFGGKVVRVLRIDDCGAILVRYGSYFIVYFNLKDIFVNQNDSIKQYQVIATMLPGDPDLYEVVICFLNRNVYQDPETWFVSDLNKFSRRKFHQAILKN